MDDAIFVKAYDLVVYIVLRSHARAFRKMGTLARAYLI